MTIADVETPSKVYTPVIIPEKFIAEEKEKNMQIISPLKSTLQDEEAKNDNDELTEIKKLYN